MYHVNGMPNKEFLVEKCRECGTRTKTAEWFGVSTNTITKWLNHYGGPLKWVQHDRPSKEDLVNKCHECVTQYATAEWYGVDPSTIKRWLNHYDNPVKWGRGRRRKGYSKLELTQAALRKASKWVEVVRMNCVSDSQADIKHETNELLAEIHELLH